MIPQAYITAWRKKAPWQEDYQVEQDFLSDMQGLLRPNLSYNIVKAYEFVKTELLEKI